MEYRPEGGHRFIFKQPLFVYFNRFQGGGGDTSIRIDIGKADFPLLWQSMTEADQTAALRAMLGELKRRDRVLTRAARAAAKRDR